MKDQLLWDKINDFKLDKSNVSFSFSQRLARDNNWTQQYSDRVILEYKRFIYLCRLSNQPITPSDAVDQAWHLHLTYTNSYWKELCQNTLGKEIHHNPTEGGKVEKSKFSNLYDNTFEIYRSEFKQDPPKDIWWENQKRFKEINFRRINLNQNWVIPKPKKKIIKSISIATFCAFLFLLFVQADGSPFYMVAAFIVIAYIISMTKNGKNDNHGCDSGCDSGCNGCGGCGD